MEKEKTLTKLEIYQLIKTHLTEQDEIDFIDSQIALLEKRKNRPKKLTDHQKENLGYMEMILEYMKTIDKPVTIADLQANIEPISMKPHQRISALMKKLVDGGQVKREYIDRKTHFSIISSEE